MLSTYTCISMLSVDAADFYMYIYTLLTESGFHQSRGCVDRRTGGRNLCTGACNHGKSSDSADNAYNVLCLPMVSYCKFIYILLFSSAMHSLKCYSSNPWTPMTTARWSHSADGRRILCWWSASCLSRLHITTNTEQRNFCLSCQSSRSVLHSNLLEFKFCSSLKSVYGKWSYFW